MGSSTTRDAAEAEVEVCGGGRREAGVWQRAADLWHAPLSPTATLVGIDLGTSFSSIAAAVDGDEGLPCILADALGNRTIPSVVAFTEEGATLVGWDAVAAKAGATNTFYSFKRLMGQPLSRVARDAARLLYTVGEGDRGEVLVYSPVADGTVTPEELSAEVLRHLLALAQQALQQSVTGAVITVPAHFNQKQQGATLAAARLAGLPQVLLLQEPVAAALAHGIGGSTDGDTVLVFDLGGGTFDVSILQAFEGIVEVLATAGDSYLGGDDLDTAVAAWLLEQLPQAADADSSSSIGDWEWAVRAAERGKVQLAHASSTDIEIPGGRCVLLTRERFEDLTAHLFQRMAGVLEGLGSHVHVEWAMEPCMAAAGSSSITEQAEHQQQRQQRVSERDGLQRRHEQDDRWAPPPRRVTRVVLVGQSTRLPTIQAFVERLTGVRPSLTIDPAEAVALGAAVHAGMLLGQVGSIELMDGSYSAELHGRASGWNP
eukprot:scaffold18.g1990.t1